MHHMNRRYKSKILVYWKTRTRTPDSGRRTNNGKDGQTMEKTDAFSNRLTFDEYIAQLSIYVILTAKKIANVNGRDFERY